MSKSTIVKTFYCLVLACLILTSNFGFSCGGGPECELNYSIDLKSCPQNRLFKQQNGTVRNAVYMVWKYLGVKNLEYHYPKSPQIKRKQYFEKLSDITGKSITELESTLLSAKKREITHWYNVNPIGRHNSYHKVITFLKIVKKSTPDSKDFMLLVRARDAALHGETISIKSVKSKNLRSWLQYIEASRLFYQDKLISALTMYTNLSASLNPWIKETSLYMTARVVLISSQEKFDGYNQQLIDRNLLNKSQSLFSQYLTLYPNGLYASSANNLKRRFLWFNQRRAALNDAIINYFIQSLKDKNTLAITMALHEIFQRFDYKLLISGRTTLPLRSPILSALLLANTARLKNYKASSDDLIRLKKNQLNYIPYPGLYNYINSRLLNAAGLYSSTVKVKVTPENSIFKHAFLLQQLIANKKLKNSRQTLENLQTLLKLNTKHDHERQLIIEKIYLYYINNNLSVALLANQSILGAKINLYYFFKRIKNSDAIHLSFQQSVPAKRAFKLGQFLLAAQYSKKDYAQFLISLNKLKSNPIYMKELRRRSEKSLPPAQRTPDFFKVESAIKALLKNTKDPKALFNVGYFNNYYSFYNQKNEGFAPLTYDHAPLDYFEKSLALLSNTKKYDFEDRLLYYLIRCFKNSKEAIVSCVAEHTQNLNIRNERYHSKKWITRLVRKYPTSKWIKKLPPQMIKGLKK
ncbi:hypothetical protein MNBD_GAMMA12-1086 [hydrothermal vent metagenome]|uniref:Uncharacterized protein n=1 Tax=hydrothermal vent metagenome TaxID=652676 RepID=A0A3B0YBP1_9ZZZZ